jgi:two-component system chemotaxis response regulator CheY
MGCCILLVDDSATVRSLVKVFLMGHDLEYLEAEGGEHGLEILRGRVPDLVIADLNMPGMDGISFVKRVRSDTRPEVRSLPVILFTSDKSHDVRERALQAGASAFVRKPVSSSDLQEALRRLLPGAFADAGVRSQRGR